MYLKFLHLLHDPATLLKSQRDLIRRQVSQARTRRRCRDPGGKFFLILFPWCEDTLLLFAFMGLYSELCGILIMGAFSYDYDVQKFYLLRFGLHRRKPADQKLRVLSQRLAIHKCSPASAPYMGGWFKFFLPQQIKTGG